MLNDDPAEKIARHWYEGFGLEYLGIDFGHAMTYNILQIVNRARLKKREEDGKSEIRPDNDR